MLMYDARRSMMLLEMRRWSLLVGMMLQTNTTISSNRSDKAGEKVDDSQGRGKRA